jgi:3-hydroxyacyl-[acyl-carrier-protein] dehydratase
MAVSVCNDILHAQALMPTSSNVIEYRDLVAYLPHRFPFLLVDRVLTYEASKMIRGVKNVSSAEPYWQTNPRPRYPPGLIIEAMGQLALILYMIGQKATAKELFLGSLSDVKILRSVEKPDQLTMELWVDKELDGTLIAHGWAETTEGKTVILGQMIAVTRSRG